MTPEEQLSGSRALWNREALDLESDEILAQILDRGSWDDWRALYRLATGDPRLRRRIVDLVERVPLYLPNFWLAAMRALGEEVDMRAVAPREFFID